jgi:flagellar biogenesis protein FliO
MSTITLTELYSLLTEKEVVNSTRNLASKKDLANTKKEMIKWFVGLFFALALMVIGLYFK